MCVCAAAVMGVCSCSDSEDEKVIDKKVALILPSGKSIARWTDDAKYLSEALGKNGYEAKLFTAEETLEGAAEQVKQIEEAIKAGYTHFVITAIDHNAINNSGLLQANQNCDFICYDRMIMDNDAVDYYVTCDLAKVGEMQAQYLLSSYRASGKETMTIEYFAGPATDKNAAIYFESAANLFYGKDFLSVPSNKKSYSEVSLDSWTADAAKAEMLNRITKTGVIPDFVLAPNDNVADGIISALIDKECTTFPFITGQDLTAEAKKNIKEGKQSMSIYKEYKKLAENAAMVVSSFILGNPASTDNTFNNGVKEVPVKYSDITLVTKDNVDQY